MVIAINLVNLAVVLVGSLVFVWLAFVVVLLIRRPAASSVKESLRIVPDVIRLVRRLATNRSLRRGVRARLWLLLAYLASPIDLVPDFIPVIGYADDAIITSLVLRSVVRSAGAETVRRSWPGTPEGLAVLGQLCRVPDLTDERA